MNLRYGVDRNQEERDHLTTMLSGGTYAARKPKPAQILLAADAGETDEAIAAWCEVTRCPVSPLRGAGSARILIVRIKPFDATAA
jgi:hypothetical protein